MYRISYVFIGLLLGTMLGFAWLVMSEKKERRQLVGKEIVISGDTLKVIGVDDYYDQLIMNDGSLLSREVVKAFLNQ